MQFLVGIFQIFIYFLIGIFNYKIAKKYTGRVGADESLKQTASRKVWMRIFFIALLWGFFSVWCGRKGYVSDRGNYAYRFDNGYDYYFQNNSLGLYWIVKLLHLFTYNSKYLFFFIALLYSILINIAYYSYRDKSSLAVLYLSFSLLYAYSFYLLKQALAIPIIAIAVSFSLKRKYLFCYLLLAVSAIFHESSMIMFPLAIALIFVDRKPLIRLLVYLLLFITLLFFRQIEGGLLSIVIRIVPSLATQARSYFSEENSFDGTNFLTMFKGLPYYIIFLYGLINRKELIKKINNYHSFMLLSFFSSICSFLSGYMYWMWRFGTLCYVPVFVFGSLICKYSDRKQDTLIFLLSSLMSLFLISFRYLYQVLVEKGGF